MIDFSAHPWMAPALGDPEMSALFAADADLQRYLKIEAAWTRSLGAVEGNPNADTIAKAIETATIDAQALADGVARDGLAIPALVTCLKAKVAQGDHALIHRGLTSQDVIDTSTVLALADAIAIILKRIAILDDMLADLKAQNGDASLMAFTRMQPALETTAADVITRWQQPIPALLRDLTQTRAGMAQVQWGGPIGTRDHPQASTLGASFAKQLGLRDPGHAWHTDRTTFVNAGHVMVRATTALGKIAEDIALMAAVGDQIAFAGGGSSAMPHKNNPVAAEIAIALSDYAITLNASLARASRHEGHRSGRAWTLEWIALPQLCITTGTALLQMTRMLENTVSIGRA